MANINKIMFSTKYGLQQAVLNGTKTMTRRRAHKILVENENQELIWNGQFKKPWYNVDYVLGVAQPYKEIESLYSEPDTLIFGSKTFDGITITGYYPVHELPGWNNKMFVSGQYMQHFLRVTDVKLEKLQDISEEDCMREGIFIDKVQEENGLPKYAFDIHTPKYTSRQWFPTAKEAFEYLIKKINGNQFWDENPYMYAYSFELIKKGGQ